MAFLRLTVNEYGSAVSEHRCDACGTVFTLCPGYPKLSGEEADVKWGGCCLGEGCESYDLSRDIDLIWDHVDIEREEVKG